MLEYFCVALCECLILNDRKLNNVSNNICPESYNMFQFCCKRLQKTMKGENCTTFSTASSPNTSISPLIGCLTYKSVANRSRVSIPTQITAHAHICDANCKTNTISLCLKSPFTFAHSMNSSTPHCLPCMPQNQALEVLLGLYR